MKALHMAAFVLVIVGAVNWGLMGLLGMNLVSTLFGSSPTLENLVYVLVGASGVWLVITHRNDCKVCSAKK